MEYSYFIGALSSLPLNTKKITERKIHTPDISFSEDMNHS